MVPSDSPNDIASIRITHDPAITPMVESKYYVHTRIKRAGWYSTMGALLTQGSPRLILFNNPDFTDNVHYLRMAAPADQINELGGFQQIFNSTFVKGMTRFREL